MDNLELIVSLREINSKLQVENKQLKEDNERLVSLLEKYEPREGKKDKDKDKADIYIWGEGETGWGKY